MAYKTLYGFQELDVKNKCTHTFVHCVRNLSHPRWEKLHMIVYRETGDIEAKINLCLCEERLKGNFSLCSTQVGIFISNGQVLSISDDNEEVNDDNNDKFNGSELQDNEIPVKTFLILWATVPLKHFILQQILVSCFLHMPSNWNGIASKDEDIRGSFDPLQKGQKCIKVYYLQKPEETKEKVSYKMLTSDDVFVLPKQVFYQFVPLDENLAMLISDYQFLSDCMNERMWYPLFHNRNLQFALILGTIYSTNLNCKRPWNAAIANS